MRGVVARLVLVALAPFALDGCVSVGLSRSALSGEPGQTGAVTVGVYKTTADRDASRTVAHPVLAELVRVEGEARTTVARSMAPTWSLADLPPGRYELRLSKMIDENGDVVPLSGSVAKELDVKAGTLVKADVVLEKVPVFWIVVAVITVVLLVILAIELSKDGGLPPLPPPPPLPPGFVAVAVEVPLGRATGPAASEPGVADVFPAPGAVVASRRIATSFFLTMPIDPHAIEAGAVLAVGSRSGEVPGTVSFREEERLLRFVPDSELTPGEEVTVTLDLSKVESRLGKSGKGRVTTTFRVR